MRDRVERVICGPCRNSHTAGDCIDTVAGRVSPWRHCACQHRRRSDESSPGRIQLGRHAGWRLPEGARSVAAPTRWANPFRPSRRTLEANAAAVDAFIAWLGDQPELVAAAKLELRGRDLACWCTPDLPYHADVWLAIANGETSQPDTGYA